MRFVQINFLKDMFLTIKKERHSQILIGQVIALWAMCWPTNLTDGILGRVIVREPIWQLPLIERRSLFKGLWPTYSYNDTADMLLVVQQCNRPLVIIVKAA